MQASSLPCTRKGLVGASQRPISRACSTCSTVRSPSVQGEVAGYDLVRVETLVAGLSAQVLEVESRRRISPSASWRRCASCRALAFLAWSSVSMPPAMSAPAAMKRKMTGMGLVLSVGEDGAS